MEVVKRDESSEPVKLDKNNNSGSETRAKLDVCAQNSSEMLDVQARLCKNTIKYATSYKRRH